MGKVTVTYTVGAIVLLCFNIIAVVFDIMPDWWYYGWMFSVETSKAVSLYMSIGFLTALAAVLIIMRGRR